MEDEPPLAVDLAYVEEVDVLSGAGDKRPTADAPHGLSMAPVPVTVVTGFLGSGKTTLVRHVLTAPHGYKVAVIMNEYGEDTGMEDGLLKSQDVISSAALGEWVELANGCMCCSVKTNFVQALEALMKRRERFDYIIIETTGLANPGPIASSLWTDEQLEAGVQLDAVVTVVDAINISRQLNELRPEGSVNEAQLQIAYADLILLNKMDLAKDEAVTRAEADIRAINSTVPIIRTSRSTLPLEQLLNRQNYTNRAEGNLPPILEEDADGQAAATAPVPHAVTHSNSSRARRNSKDSSRRSSGEVECLDACACHDGKVETISLRCQQPLCMEKFKAWVDHNLWDREARSDDIYRMKGVLNIQGSAHRHHLQAVYELYDITEGPAWRAGEARYSHIVVIGRGLKKASLQALFHACADVP